jgi:lysophospholipase L1-like esterase
MSRPLLALVIWLLAVLPVSGADFALEGKKQILFLGDSITYAGTYISYVDAYLFTRFPERHYTLINLGLPSETASGLSEPDHPFPRPDVHERLTRALSQVKPDVVVICYGMNDGIYHPPAKQRLKKFQQGIQGLLAEVSKVGARITLMTPPPFDPIPIKDKVLPRSASKFAWFKPYADYDDVLAGYARWELTLRDKDLTVVDVHVAIRQHLDMMRARDGSYRLAGDGIHPNATGHWLIAQQLLSAWHAPAEVDSASLDAVTGKVQKGEVSKVVVGENEISLTWKTGVPMPYDPRWAPDLVKQQRIGERFNRQRLTISGVKGERYTLFEGEKRLGTVTKKELAGGVAMLRFADFFPNQRARELWKLVSQRQQLLSRAWLSAVGHKRPGIKPGLPLAEAQRQAAGLEMRIRELAHPVEVMVRVVKE